MEREQFLNRIALSLGRGRVVEQPAREVRGVSAQYASHPYGADGEPDGDIVARFVAATEALGAHSVVAQSRAGAAEALDRLLSELHPEATITWDRAEYRGWPLDWLWDRLGAIPTGAFAAAASGVNALRESSLHAGVGVTLADCAIANTGTLMLCCTTGRPRSVSLLPTIHVALIDEQQIVDRMGPALATISADSPPSSINLISGPSRSGDIEGDLSVGVHGPAAVYVIIARK